MKTYAVYNRETGDFEATGLTHEQAEREIDGIVENFDGYERGDLEIQEEEKCRGKDYLLRDIPADLMMRAKHRAVDENCSVRELILRSLEAYLS